MPFEGCAAHDHDCEAEECSGSWSLYRYIDTPKVRCLNEAAVGSCRAVFKPWHQRADAAGPSLRSSEDDPELLLHVPFTGAVKLRAISVVGGPDGAAPRRLRVYVNRDDLDFGAVEDLPPVQEWELLENADGRVEYPTQITKFNGVHSVDLHFPDSCGADFSEVRFVGFKGEFTERRRQAVDAVYESKPIPADHKVPDGEAHLSQLGM